MFTGIIQEIGKVDSIAQQGSLTKLEISAPLLCAEAAVSDSIAVNGVCLTLIKKDKKVLFFEAVAPTLKKTNLRRLKRGDSVNLESALAVGQKVGGHFVLGHSDGEVKLRRSVKHQKYWELEIEFPARFRRYIVENGSVALEGVSLTVKRLTSNTFTLAIIPFTYIHTTLQYKKSGSWLNIEFDYLLKKSK